MEEVIVSRVLSAAPANELSLFRMFLALLCPLSVVGVSHYLQLGIGMKIVTSLIRTITQLLLAGYVLLGFIFHLQSPFAVGAYLLMMCLIAALEVSSLI